MKNIFKTIKNKVNNIVNSVVTVIQSVTKPTKQAVAGKAAEGFVDSGIKIIISVVIGALLLGGLYALFNSTILPTMSEKISEMFSYAG